MLKAMMDSYSYSDSGSCSDRTLNRLGNVYFYCNESGLAKVGKVLPDGRIYHQREGVYGNVLEWLEEAPLDYPERAEIARTAKLASESLESPSLEIAVKSIEDMYGPNPPRGRRRSRSIQSPTGGLAKESALMLNSLEDDMNEWRAAYCAPVENDDGSISYVNTTAKENPIPIIKAHFKDYCDRICLWQGNPTALICDGVTRSCSARLVDSNRGHYWEKAFHQAGVRLLVSCETYLAQEKLKEIPSGGVVVTPAFELAAKYIVHIAAYSNKIYEETSEAERIQTLETFYTKTLEKAMEKGLKTLIIGLIGDDKTYTTKESATAILNVLKREVDGENTTNNLWDLERLVVACWNEAELKMMKEILHLTSL